MVLRVLKFRTGNGGAEATRGCCGTNGMVPDRVIAWHTLLDESLPATNVLVVGHDPYADSARRPGRSSGGRVVDDCPACLQCSRQRETGLGELATNLGPSGYRVEVRTNHDREPRAPALELDGDRVREGPTPSNGLMSGDQPVAGNIMPCNRSKLAIA